MKIEKGRFKMSKKIILIVLLILVIQLVAGIIFFELDPENTNVNFEPANSQNETDKTIRLSSFSVAFIVL